MTIMLSLSVSLFNLSSYKTQCNEFLKKTRFSEEERKLVVVV